MDHELRQPREAPEPPEPQHPEEPAPPQPNARVAYGIVVLLAIGFIYRLVVNQTVDLTLAGLLTVIAFTFAGYKVDSKLISWLGPGGKQ